MIDNSKVKLPINNNIVYKDMSVNTLDKQREAYKMVEEVIKNLDEPALYELLGGGENDIDDLLDVIAEESYATMFGFHGAVQTADFQYLDKLTAIVEETYCIENITYFILSKVPEFDLDWFHVEWGQYVMNYLKVCILASRDIGKSFYFSNVYPIWKMYRYKKFDRYDPFSRKDLSMSARGFLLTNEMDLSKELLEIMKGTIEGNDALRDRLYPDGKRDGWSKESIKCKNGAKFGVKSYGGSFRGRHPGYLICDDYLRENVIYSATQRTKSNNYFHATLMNALSKGGQCMVVGTPMHELDIYGDLKTKPKVWKYFEYPAIFPDGTLTCEARYNYEDLMDVREEQGSLMFTRERLVRPIVSDSSLFSTKIVRTAIEGMKDYVLVPNIESFPIEFESVVVGVDLAISGSVGADFSVYTVWGIDRRGDFWLLYIYRAKGKSYGAQISQLNAINQNFRPDLFCIESNQMQAIFGEGAEENGLPVMLHNTGENKYNFKYGLPSLSVMFERRKFHFPYGNSYSREVADLIMSEFGSITWTDSGLEGVGAHDDCVMSSWKGVTGATHLKGVGFGLI